MIIKWILVVIILIFLLGVVWNAICKKVDERKMQNAYGDSVQVNGKNMVVEIVGENHDGPPIILLPGLGEPSPILEFRPLASELSKKYEVITIEPFGYGLSYTEFTYQNLKTEGTYPNVKVSVDVTNTGEVPGKEIVEIYAGKKDSAVERAVKELRGFGKVELNPGDTKTVTVEPEAFQYYNEEKAMFVTESGTYQIYAGKSVEDICCECEIEIE